MSAVMATPDGDGTDYGPAFSSRRPMIGDDLTAKSDRSVQPVPPAVVAQRAPLAWHMLDDGRVRVDFPTAVARDLLRRLTRDLTAEVERLGVRITADTERLLYALHACAQGTAGGPPASDPSFDKESTQRDSSTVELTVKEAARLLECTPQWVCKLVRTGRVDARRVGRSWLVDRTSLDHFRTGEPPDARHRQRRTALLPR